MLINHRAEGRRGQIRCDWMNGDFVGIFYICLCGGTVVNR